jgi:hypothetical protein
MKAIAPGFITALIHSDLFSRLFTNLSVSEIIRMNKNEQDMESAVQEWVRRTCPYNFLSLLWCGLHKRSAVGLFS